MLHPLIKLLKKLGIPRSQLAIDAQTRVGPTANPFAIVKIRMRRVAVASMRLVITAARTKRSRPALAAIGLVVHVMLFEKTDLHQPVDAGRDGSKLVLIGTGESMAESDIAIRRN